MVLKAYVLEINTKTKPNPIDVAEPEEKSRDRTGRNIAILLRFLLTRYLVPGTMYWTGRNMAILLRCLLARYLVHGTRYLAGRNIAILLRCLPAKYLVTVIETNVFRCFFQSQKLKQFFSMF